MTATQRATQIALLLLATSFSGAAAALEEPEYTVVETHDEYEVRHYAPSIVAEIDVRADSREEAGNRAFRVLAGYIFGKNQSETRMAMTAPVEAGPATEPLSSYQGVESQRTVEGLWTYAFMMERKYTLESLPQPDDAQIRLVERPQRHRAALRYSGSWTDRNDEKHGRRLLEALAAASVPTRGELIYARYNAPFVPTFMRRNEVLIEVSWDGASQQPPAAEPTKQE